ncbi:MAG: inositol monophosphatase family protein [Chloroflexota bacterium]
MSRAEDADRGRRLRFAHDLLDLTDAVAVRAFRGELTVRAKPDRTLVTEADTEIERLIRERVAARYPTDGFLGEELGADQASAESRWIVDPIDATHNFVRGIGVFATLLAFERAGALELGLVSAPALGQRWFATRGAGAFFREAGADRPIRVSSIGRLAEAHVLYGSIGRLGPRREARLAAMARGAWRNRGFGDFWGHMLVAQGSAEVMVEAELRPWDVAAPAIILVEAGGRLTDFAGRPSWSGPEAVSTNGLLHDTVLARLAG